MQKLKFSNNTMIDVLFAEQGEVYGNQRSIDIGVVLSKDKTPLDIEQLFKNNASRIKIGDIIIDEETEQEEFVVSKVFEGYTTIKNYTVDRNFIYDIDQKVDLMRVIMQEPGIDDLLKSIQDGIERGLNS